MSRQRPALRGALLGIAAAMAGFTVIAAYLGWQAHTYQTARHRATAETQGTVVEDSIGDANDIRVRWNDPAGREHVQRFGIYDTGKYKQGDSFPVAYDPTDPSARAFPADPYETSEEDDLLVPIWLAGATTIVMILWWGLRGMWFRRASGKPGRPMTATTLSGEKAIGAFLSFGASSWIALATTGGEHSPDRWQRVMWHPALDTVHGNVDVLVHGDPSSDRRVVVELADGTRLVSVGRLHPSPPKRVVLDERPDLRAVLADSFILPAGTVFDPPHLWWRPGMRVALAGAAIGAVVGFLIWGGGNAVLPFVVGTSALLVNCCALAGAEP